MDLRLVPASGARWTVNGVEQRETVSCVDVDLGFTPATNLIALRRLALRIGDQMEAPAAYLRFPELTLERLDQSCQKLSATEYLYESPSFGYSGILQVNDYGAVIIYPDLWAQETS